ncbi:transcriptional regulator, BadM/Rrf2 family [Micromonospora yangpuensis]|uniref:Transcriptional regulator, BadM/Rrf2 family n=2 Tax=Micromonosporaceae TaxID=28056 RepID=A0A1C6UZ66_9ACTN|nr:transcriptional regulator, BadM/Rrf2 family [Micromonospora yangpuensis]
MSARGRASRRRAASNRRQGVSCHGPASDRACLTANLADMRLSARVDYALRAAAELAAVPEGGRSRPVTAEQIARAQEIPPKFLESILLQLRRGGIVHAQRGPEGGYWLARPAAEISLAEVIRVIDGPLAHVRGQRPEQLGYLGAARALQEVWIALRASERQILELVSIADVAAGKLPERINELVADPDAWV